MASENFPTGLFNLKLRDEAQMKNIEKLNIKLLTITSWYYYKNIKRQPKFVQSEGKLKKITIRALSSSHESLLFDAAMILIRSYTNSRKEFLLITHVTSIHANKFFW